MNTSHALRRAVLPGVILAATVMLAGCTALDPVEDHTRFYTLARAGDSGQMAAVAPVDAPVIGLVVTQVASHLRSSAIVVRSGEHEIRYEEAHRWASRLDEGVARGLVVGVQREAGSRISVSVAAPLRMVRPDVLIEIDLLACEGRRAGAESAALLVADWRIFHGREEKPAASGRFRVDKAGWNGADYGQLAAMRAASVEELAQAVGGPAVRIAGES